MSNNKGDEARTTYACEDCDWTGTATQLAGIAEIRERVMPGEFMACGCCPECGSLIGVPDDEIPEYTLQSAERIMASRGLGTGSEMASALTLLLADPTNNEARLRCISVLSAYKALASKR